MGDSESITVTIFAMTFDAICDVDGLTQSQHILGSRCTLCHRREALDMVDQGRQVFRREVPPGRHRRVMHAIPQGVRKRPIGIFALGKIRWCRL